MSSWRIKLSPLDFHVHKANSKELGVRNKLRVALEEPYASVVLPEESEHSSEPAAKVECFHKEEIDQVCSECVWQVVHSHNGQSGWGDGTEGKKQKAHVLIHFEL